MMFQREFDIAALMQAYAKAGLDARGRQELEAWLAAGEANRELFNNLMNERELKDKMLKFNAVDTEVMWGKTLKGISVVDARMAHHNSIKVLKLWPRFAVAAAAVAVMVLGIWFFNSGPAALFPGELRSKTIHHDIGPGKQGATLTLASGKKIRLADAAEGEIAKEDGISVTKTAGGLLNYADKAALSYGRDNRGAARYNTLSTAKGETYIVTLPDKSKVWLNAATTLTYSAGLLQNGTRTVKLEGEAYFEIARDKKHPFIVESGGQQVEVLGTHFNVNSYADEQAIATTLLEGSVKVSAPSRKAAGSLVLKPGEQLTNGPGGFKVARVDTDRITDWKNGEFNLDEQPFRTAMRKIARWYNVEVIYDASVPDNIKSGGWISRDVKLQVILEGIERSGQAHFKLEGRKLYISK